MTVTQERFFALVRAGLWGTPADATLFPQGTDWEELYRCARAQALLGIVFDGVQTLPAECRPPRMLYLQWCNALYQIEENNKLLNRELANVYALCREHGIEPVLLKGQGVAQNYREPLHRHCGDIDLFPGEKHYQTVEELLKRTGAVSNGEENFKHAGFNWHGITIENHRVLNNLNAPCADRRFQNEIKHWLNANEMRQVQVDTCTVSVPPLSFDAVYILMHAALHALNEGIGLRQICDWTNLLSHQRKALDKHQVKRMLNECGLSKSARIFGVIAVNYLGLPVECLPIPYSKEDEATGEWLLEDIWHSGNFGQYNVDKKRRPKGYWSSKWYTITQMTLRCWNMKRLAPAEAFWYPIVTALHSIRMQWQFRVMRKNKVH